MIGLLFAALRSRPAQVLTVVLLAAFVTGSAVAVPAYLTIADRSVISAEWDAASPAERTLSISSTVDLDGPRDRTFESNVPGAFGGTDFTTVFSAETDVYMFGNGAISFPRFAFRQDVCRHVVLRAGRCPVSSGEVMIGASLAHRLGMSAGQAVLAQNAVPASKDLQLDPDGGLAPNPNEPPMTVSIVAIYAVPDASDGYWATQGYFAPNQRGVVNEPVFTTRGTLEALGHPRERQYVDALLSPTVLRPQRLAALRAEVAAAKQNAAHYGGLVSTDLPDLLDRVQRDRTSLRTVVPLGAVPLFGLGWFLLYFAVAYPAEQRRAEIGAVKLRGTARVRHWALALGDSVLAVLAGAVLAIVVALAWVGSAANLWWYALVALGGGLLAVALAGRRAFSGPVVELLRQVPPRAARWRLATVEGALVALAIAAVVQLRASSGNLTGVMFLAPGLVLLAAALLAGHTVVPVAAVLGRRAIRRGRLARGLGAMALARRPGVARLLTVLTVALAELVLATGAADVAAQARTQRASMTLGAPRVLSVAPVSTAQLLDAVRRADPQGRYAMAATEIPKASDSDPPMLAVDSSRLARVASWWPQYGRLSAAEVAARLHPGGPAPVLVRKRQIVLDVTVPAMSPAGVRLFVGVLTADDTFGRLVDMGALRTGRHQYLADVPECLRVCRVTSVQVASQGGTVSGSLVLHSITEGPAPAFTPVDAGLTGPGRWRTPQPRGDDDESLPDLSPGPDGLAVRFHGTATIASGRILPIDTAYPLPAVSTVALPRPALGHLGVDPLPVIRAGTANILPQLGRNGILVDLEYADRLGSSTTDASSPSVWLGADAPADIVQRLAAAGLTVID